MTCLLKRLFRREPKPPMADYFLINKLEKNLERPTDWEDYERYQDEFWKQVLEAEESET
jgi:hypothetical protein